MGIKKNVIYNSILTLSNYVFGIILLPYITRVLGVSNIGAVDFVTNIVSYAIIIASLGIPMIGTRIIAKSKYSQESLNKSFSNLLLLNILYTTCTIAVFSIISLYIESLSAYRQLLYIGVIHIIASPFLIEWLYRGLENFKYIALRNIIVRCLYVVCVFIFVKEKEDYIVYYGLTVGTIVINAAINILHARKFVKFDFSEINISSYFLSSIKYGIYLLVTSMYATISVAYLGLCTDNTQVGYYSIATKLFTIIVGFFSAFTAVVMSRASALIASNDYESHKLVIEKSINFVLSLSVPAIIVLEVLTPQIIMLIAGSEFMPAVGVCRIITPLILLVGIDQILANQILIPLEKDNWVLRASILGAIIGVSLNILLVDAFLAKGTACALLMTEIVLCIYYTSLINRKKIHHLKLIPSILKHLYHSIPYFIICITIQYLSDNLWIIFGFCIPLCVGYFIVDQLFLLKNDLFIKLMFRKK